MGRYQGLQLEGGKQFRKALKEAGDDLSDLKDIHREAAAIVAEASREVVPHKSGALEASIRPAGTKTAGIIRAGKKSVPYANAIHWGRKMWPSMTAAPAPPRQRHLAPIRPTYFITGPASQSEPEWVELYFSKVTEMTEKIERESQP